MQSFLQLVAHDLYAKIGNDLSRTVLVFPNKRANLFFNEHLAGESDQPIWSPAAMSISDLFRKLSVQKAGDPIRLVCELYKVFREETESQETLDDFYFWGELLINKAARYGRPNRGLPQDRIADIDEGIELCNDDFETGFDDYRTNFLVKAEEEAKLRVRILEERRDALWDDWSERLKELNSSEHDHEAGIKGRRAMMSNRITKKLKDLEAQIKGAEFGAREVDNHQLRVSSGVILVEG